MKIISIDYSELLNIFKSSLILTNKVFNYLDGNFHKLNAKNKLRHHILYRIKSTSTTIFHILPQDINTQIFVDITSSAILTRNIMESYKTFYYLTSDDINESEFQFRFIMFEIYDILERQEMIRRLKATELKEPGEQT